MASSTALAASSVCMPPSSMARVGSVATVAAAAQRKAGEAPSSAANRHVPAPIPANHKAFTGPRASAPAVTCAIDCSTSPAHGASAQT